MDFLMLVPDSHVEVDLLPFFENITLATWPHLHDRKPNVWIVYSAESPRQAI